MNNRKIHILLLTLNFGLAVFLIVYFWFFHQYEDEKAQTFILILALVYISVEMIKKNFLKIDFIWNRLYYIGLFAIIAPIAFSEKLPLDTIRIINQLGILFLLSPFLIEGKYILKNKS
jgi:hypothetical protein